jgi:hypothetical protein
MDQPAEPIPIPEADARSRKARTVRIQDILAAHARALDVRIEEGMREMRLAMESAVRRSAIQEAPQATPPAPPPQAPPAVAPPQPAPLPEAQAPTLPREDVARGLAQQTEERFQSLALRLQRIEDAVRTVALARGDAGELGGKLEALTDGMNRVAASEEDLFDRLIEAQRDGIEDLTRRVGTGVSAVIRAMQNELNATITRLELTADATAAVSPGDTARLERTMMAIAEHQESVLDGRLSELRESMASFQQTEETAAEVEDVLALDEKTAPEGPRLGVEEAFPWPEPLPELADESATDEAASEPAAEDAEATQEEPSAETAAAEKATETVEEPEVGEAGTTSEEEPAVEDKPVKKKRRRKKKSPEPAETD